MFDVRSQWKKNLKGLLPKGYVFNLGCYYTLSIGGIQLYRLKEGIYVLQNTIMVKSWTVVKHCLRKSFLKWEFMFVWLSQRSYNPQPHLNQQKDNFSTFPFPWITIWRKKTYVSLALISASYSETFLPCNNVE